MSKEQLTDQQEHYCQLRASGQTKTGAAKIAYQTAHPSKVGWELEEKEHIRDRIQQLKEERMEAYGLDPMEQIRRYNELYQLALSQNKLETAKNMLMRIDALGGFEAPKKSQSVSLKGDLGGDTFKSLEGNTKLSKDIEKFSGILGNTKEVGSSLEETLEETKGNA